MGRPKRANEAGGIYHALNRANARAPLVFKPEDYDALERILAEGLERYPCRILSYQLMPNHWHFVLQPTEDGGMSNFLRWISLTHTMRRHAHYQTAGEGHIYQGRFKSFPIQGDGHFLTVCRYVEPNALSAGLVVRAEDWRWGSLFRWLAHPVPEPKLLSPWPIPRLPNWTERVNAALSEKELKAIRSSVQRGAPYGDSSWVETTASRLELETTLQPRGRPPKSRKKSPDTFSLARWWVCWLIAVVVCFTVSDRVGTGPLLAGEPDEVRYAQDIQPLLAERCLLCHGPDEAEAGLRLDLASEANRELPSGARAIVAGNPDASELLRRLNTDDDSQRMPPDGEPLSAEEIDAFRRWIAAGAKFETHWAFKPVELPPLAEVSEPAWCESPIDHFVLARLDAAGLVPSPQADRYTLIKRLYFDLVGLSPTPEQVDAFVHDQRPDAYRRLVDQLLDSRHFGERWGRHWLDMARYADSDGYEKDRPRPNAWRYRDWVIQAINDDLPLDEFTILQLAGDLLPETPAQQHLATAFHRQTLTNTEGGTDQEEFRVEATFDRTETTAGVWMGLTLNCARCHSHKYDPISQTDYYRLFAMFNSTSETEIEVPRSDADLLLYEKAKGEYDARLAELESQYAAALETLRPRIDAWEQTYAANLEAESADSGVHERLLDQITATASSGVSFRQLDDGSLLVEGPAVDKDRYTLVAPAPPGTWGGLNLELLPDPSLGEANGPGRTAHGNFVLTQVTVEVSANADFSTSQTIELASAEADFSQNKFPPANALDADPKTGWAISPKMGQPHTLTIYTANPQNWDTPSQSDPAGQPQQQSGQSAGEAAVQGGWLRIVLDQQYGGQHTLGRFRLSTISGVSPDRGLPETVRKALAKPAERRSASNQRVIDDYVAAQHEDTAGLLERLNRFRKQTPPSPLMPAAVLKPQERTTRRLERGDFLQPAETVASGALDVIEQVHPLVGRFEQSPDRLDLARWLVDPQHPLTSRVIVNQVWARLFGRGIVASEGDFGVRGERPTHPELLDWLAWQLPRELGWSRKRLIKTIVTSATYRQASRHRPDLQRIDPTNQLLGRQNRLRVEAEVVRDLALSSSGLIDATVGGPSVFPPLPPGVTELSYANNFKWETSSGGDRFRRGMYTFFKRTAPHPTLITFDCPDSNTARIGREVSNTPLQALTLLNNQVFAEAALGLADQVLSSEIASRDVRSVSPDADLEAGGGDLVAGGEDLDAADAERLRHAFRRGLVRPPSGAEVAAFAELLAEARHHYQANPDDAEQLTALLPRPQHDPLEYAAWGATLRMMLNLDEFIVRD